MMRGLKGPSFSHYGLDVVMIFIGWLVGIVAGWWTRFDIPLEGGIFIVLLMIWARLGLGRG